MLYLLFRIIYTYRVDSWNNRLANFYPCNRIFIIILIEWYLDGQIDKYFINFLPIGYEMRSSYKILITFIYTYVINVYVYKLYEIT